MTDLDNIETLSAEAAKSLCGVWRGHDEKNIKMCFDSAFNLYSVLSPKSDPHTKTLSAKLVQQAYWLSDEAESYQGKDEKMEKIVYQQAGDCLRLSREQLGMESESVDATINWWTAYRHNNKDLLVENLVMEHLNQFNVLNQDVAKRCTGIILEAAAKHKEKDWDAVTQKLEEYFQVYLPMVL